MRRMMKKILEKKTCRHWAISCEFTWNVAMLVVLLFYWVYHLFTSKFNISNKKNMIHLYEKKISENVIGVCVCVCVYVCVHALWILSKIFEQIFQYKPRYLNKFMKQRTYVSYCWFRNLSIKKYLYIAFHHN